jgi:hypothetical protein
VLAYAGYLPTQNADWFFNVTSNHAPNIESIGTPKIMEYVLGPCFLKVYTKNYRK